MEGKYHFVCHDCPAEAIVARQDEAETLLRDHVSETDHHGSFADVGAVTTE
ncbi:MAG: hypothetical protein ABEJ30_05005 [Halorientalis sp.]